MPWNVQDSGRPGSRTSGSFASSLAEGIFPVVAQMSTLAGSHLRDCR